MVKRPRRGHTQRKIREPGAISFKTHGLILSPLEVNELREKSQIDGGEWYGRALTSIAGRFSTTPSGVRNAITGKGPYAAMPGVTWKPIHLTSPTHILSEYETIEEARTMTGQQTTEKKAPRKPLSETEIMYIHYAKKVLGNSVTQIVETLNSNQFTIYNVLNYEGVYQKYRNRPLPQSDPRTPEERALPPRKVELLPVGAKPPTGSRRKTYPQGVRSMNGSGKSTPTPTPTSAPANGAEVKSSVGSDIEAMPRTRVVNNDPLDANSTEWKWGRDVVDAPEYTHLWKFYPHTDSITTPCGLLVEPDKRSHLRHDHSTDVCPACKEFYIGYTQGLRPRQARFWHGSDGESDASSSHCPTLRR